MDNSCSKFWLRVMQYISYQLRPIYLPCMAMGYRENRVLVVEVNSILDEKYACHRLKADFLNVCSRDVLWMKVEV